MTTHARQCISLEVYSGTKTQLPQPASTAGRRSAITEVASIREQRRNTIGTHKHRQMELPSSTVAIQAQCPHSLSLCCAIIVGRNDIKWIITSKHDCCNCSYALTLSLSHTHSVLTAIFPGYPGLAGCPLNSRSPLNSASFWDRPKLSMSLILNTISPGLFPASCLSDSFNLPR